MSVSFLEDFQDDFCGVDRTRLGGMAPSGNYFDRLSMDVDLQAEAIRDGRIDEPGLVYSGEDELHSVGSHSLHTTSEIDELHSPNFGERPLAHVGMISDDMHGHALLSHEIGDDMVGRAPAMSTATHVGDHLAVTSVDYSTVHLLEAPLFTVPSEMLAEHDGVSDDLPLPQHMNVATSGGPVPTTKPAFAVPVSRPPDRTTPRSSAPAVGPGELCQTSLSRRSSDGLRLAPSREALSPLPVVTASARAWQPFACLPSRYNQQSSAISLLPSQASLRQQLPPSQSGSRVSISEQGSADSPRSHAGDQQSSSLTSTSTQSGQGGGITADGDSVSVNCSISSGLSSSLMSSSSSVSPISSGSAQVCFSSLTPSMTMPCTANTDCTSDVNVNLTVHRLSNFCKGPLSHTSLSELGLSRNQVSARTRTPSVVSFSQSLDGVQSHQQSALCRPNQAIAVQPSQQTLHGSATRGQNKRGQEPARKSRQPRKQQQQQQQQQLRRQQGQLQQQTQGQLHQRAESTNEQPQPAVPGLPNGDQKGVKCLAESLREEQQSNSAHSGQTEVFLEITPGNDTKEKSKKTVAAESSKRKRRPLSSDGEQEVKKHKGGWPKGRPRKLHMGAPRPPCTGWQFFVSSTLRLAKDQAERSRPLSELSKGLGAKWAALSAEEKKIYMDMAVQDRERYLKELQEFQSSDLYHELLKQVERELGVDLPSDQQFDASTLFPVRSTSASGALLYCQVCQQQFTTHHNRREHMLGKQHQQNILALVERSQKCSSMNAPTGGALSPDPIKNTNGSVSRKSKRGRPLPTIDPVCVQAKIGQFAEEFYDHHRVRELELQELRLSCAVAEQCNKSLLDEVDLLKAQKSSVNGKIVALQEYGVGIQQMIARLQAAVAAILKQKDSVEDSKINDEVMPSSECSPVSTLGQSSEQANGQSSPSALDSLPPSSVSSILSETSEHLEQYSSAPWPGIDSAVTTSVTMVTGGEEMTTSATLPPVPPQSISLSLLSCPQDGSSVPLELSKDGQFEWWTEPLFKDQCPNAVKGPMQEVWLSSEAAAQARSSTEKDGSGGQQLCAPTQQLVSVS